MADELISVESDRGVIEPTPVTLMLAGKAVQLGGTPNARSNLATAQVSVTTAATLIASARPNRDSLLITNTGATDVWLGGATVTTTTGVLLPGSKGASVSLPYAGALYGIVASGSVTVTVADVY